VNTDRPIQPASQTAAVAASNDTATAGPPTTDSASELPHEQAPADQKPPASESAAVTLVEEVAAVPGSIEQDKQVEPAPVVPEQPLPAEAASALLEQGTAVPMVVEGGKHPELAQTVPEQPQPAEPTFAHAPGDQPGAATTHAAAPPIDLAAWLDRPAQLRVCNGATAAERHRDPDWQRRQREWEQQVRGAAVAFADEMRTAGVRAGTTAELLAVPVRTLRSWQLNLRGDRPPALLGRPPSRCAKAEAESVVDFLHGHGPHIGMPSLHATFPELPRAALQDLLDCYRHLWLANHPRELFELRWRRAGAVWAMDFAEVSHPIDEQFRYVLAVRDLASGLQLAWQPVADQTAETVQRELDLLFLVRGAPLVLKSDNGSAFRAGWLKAKLRRWGVWPLYSPPGCPWYNGAIEASIGSLKTRTQFEAWRQGHEDVWTSADLEEARRLANAMKRRRRGTAEEEWAERRAPSEEERDSFGAEVSRLAAAAREQKGIALDAELDHYDQAALHRRVLESVLVQRGFLWMTRRRIPQRIFGRKTADFR
jgi:transposase InsO family protein